MTKQQFEKSVRIIVCYFGILLFIAAIAYCFEKANSLYSFIKEMSSLLIALPAAYLTYCVQRRQAFLTSLRDLWKEANEAKGEVVQYTHLENPNKIEFGKAHRCLSKTIDSVRAVYKNVGEDEHIIGRYPFEPLHDMRRALESVCPPRCSPSELAAARKRMISAWNAFRWRFLPEFQAPEAPHPMTEHDMHDPRR